MPCLRITGYSNWSRNDIVVFYHGEHSDEDAVNRVKCRVASHLARLFNLIFLNVRPPPPAQSRWTGVPAVAAFCYGAFCFHNLFKSLIGALSQSSSGNARKGKGKGKGKGRGNAADDVGGLPNADADDAWRTQGAATWRANSQYGFFGFSDLKGLNASGTSCWFHRVADEAEATFAGAMAPGSDPTGAELYSQPSQLGLFVTWLEVWGAGDRTQALLDRSVQPSYSLPFGIHLAQWEFRQQSAVMLFVIVDQLAVGQP